MSLLYENVFTHKDITYTREYNTETKLSEIRAVKYVPNIYTETKEKSLYTSVNNKYLREEKFKTTKEYKDKIKILKASGVPIYGLKSYESNFIRENYGTPTDNDHEFRTLYIDIETAVLDKVTPNKITRNDWKPEGERAASAVITSIQMYDSVNKEFYILGLEKEYKNKNNFSSKHGLIRYIKCKNEVELLKMFIKILTKLNPTIIIGWNSDAYDYPYITMRIIRVLDKKDDLFYFCDESKLWKFNTTLLSGGYVKQLSPIGKITYRATETNYGINHTFKWLGYILEDYLDLYKKYTYTTLVSYSLNSVAEHELNDNKVEHDEFTNFASFYEGNYENYEYNSNKEEKSELDLIYLDIINGVGNKEESVKLFSELAYDNFINYGIQDIILLIDINNKLKLINLAKYIAFTCGVTMDMIRGTIQQWNSFMYNNHKDNNQILPYESRFPSEDIVIMEHIVKMEGIDSLKKEKFRNLLSNPEMHGQRFVGGIVRGTGKFWREVFSLDFGSLYPSIIQWANIGIETLIQPKDLPKELLDLRAKYAIFYTKDILPENMIQFDLAFVKNVINNKEVSLEIETTLKKYNVSMTPNGMFFSLDKRSVLSQTMENIINGRKIDKGLMNEQYKLMDEISVKLNKLEVISDEYKEYKEAYNKASSLADMYNVYQMGKKILVKYIDLLVK